MDQNDTDRLVENGERPNAAHVISEESLNTVLRNVLGDGDESNSKEELTTCPTCHGSGRISKEQYHQQVALIPLSDSRLKPRRTLLYVILAVVCCCLVGGLLCYFFVPRGISLSSNQESLNVTNCTIKRGNETADSITLVFMNSYTIQNDNYVPIEIKKVTMEALLGAVPDPVLQNGCNDTQVSIPARSVTSMDVHMHLTLTGDNVDILEYVCTNEKGKRWNHAFPMKFQASAEARIEGQKYRDALTTFQHIICDFPNNAKKKPHCNLIRA